MTRAICRFSHDSLLTRNTENGTTTFVFYLASNFVDTSFSCRNFRETTFTSSLLSCMHEQRPGEEISMSSVKALPPTSLWQVSKLKAPSTFGKNWKYYFKK